MDDTLYAVARAATPEAQVRRAVDIDMIGGVQELMARNVGAKLAADYHRLKTSVSELALGAAWASRRAVA